MHYITITIEGKTREVSSDADIGAHCPNHGPGANLVHKAVYRDGSTDILCHCGNQLAYIRDGKLYLREVA